MVFNIRSKIDGSDSGAYDSHRRYYSEVHEVLPANQTGLSTGFLNLLAINIVR